MEILGYYVHKEDELTPVNVMVVIDEGYKRLTCYTPIGQHSEMDRGYFNECNQITKDQYLTVSEGIYTPEEYLQ
jgi:hypothetical protein